MVSASVLHHVCIYVFKWIVSGATLICNHFLHSREISVALWAFSLKAHPELKALDVAHVLAKGELLEPVAILVICEANETAGHPMVSKLVSVGNYPHFDKVGRVHSLL